MAILIKLISNIFYSVMALSFFQIGLLLIFSQFPDALFYGAFAACIYGLFLIWLIQTAFKNNRYILEDFKFSIFMEKCFEGK